MKPSLPISRRVLPGLFVCLVLLLGEAAAGPSKLILVLGDDSYIPAEAVQALTRAQIIRGLGERDLLEFAVVIFSNIPYGLLPRGVHEGLPEFLSRGGSLLVTGGPNSYGTGGYQPIAPLLPMEIRAAQDWIAAPFKVVIPLQPEHPVLEGVTFRTVGAFNDLNPKAGAVEIARYAGGGGRRRLPFGEKVGAKFPSPMIAEQHVGNGTVLAIAFDVGREIRNGWAGGPHFVQNVLAYLVERSPLKPWTPHDISQTFVRWQEACDRNLRYSVVGGLYWEHATADCRHELTKDRYPHMDLIDLWLAERLAIAERVDRRELSADDGSRHIQELNVRILTEIQRRQEDS
ncbi:MAG: hypothetical protein ACE5MG_13230 [Candidatus Methylomirabilales bacterium]